jgi:hypothetical protein
VNVGVLGEYITSGVAGDGTEYGFYSDEGGLKVIIENVNTKELNIESTVPEITITEGIDRITIQYFLGDDLHTKVIGKQVGTLTEPRIISSTVTTPLQALEIQDVNGLGLNEIEVGKTYILSHNKVPLDTTDVVIQEWEIVSGDATINSTGEFVANSSGEIVVRFYNMNTDIGSFSDEITLTAYNMHTISAEIVGNPYGTIEMSIDGTPIDNPSEVKEGTIVDVTVTPIDETIEVVEWYTNGVSAPITSFSGMATVDKDMVIGVLLFKPNTPPIATDDESEVNSGSTVLIDVLANDTDADGDGLLISGFTQGTNGVVTQEGGSIRYAPGNGFIGMDEFQYEISDGNGGTSSAFVRITVNIDGTLVGTGEYGTDEIGIYQTPNGLTAVLENQVSTTGLVIENGSDNIYGVESMSHGVDVIYLYGGEVNIVTVVGIGQNAVEADRQTISSLDIGGSGSLNTIEYVIDGDEVIHFAYRDTNATSDDYRNDDIMYCNTVEMSPVLVARGYRDYSSSGSWGATYVHEQPHSIGVDVDGNPVIAYYQHDIWRWSNGTDNSYFLKLTNPLTNATATLESVSVTNIEVTGGNQITVVYDIGATHYTRYFDGATLTEH